MGSTFVYVHTRKEILPKKNQHPNAPKCIRNGGYFWKLKKDLQQKNWTKCSNINGGSFPLWPPKWRSSVAVAVVVGKQWKMGLMGNGVGWYFFVISSPLLCFDPFFCFQFPFFTFSLYEQRKILKQSRAPSLFSLYLLFFVAFNTLSILLSAFSKLKTEPSTEP